MIRYVVIVGTRMSKQAWDNLDDQEFRDLILVMMQTFDKLPARTSWAPKIFCAPGADCVYREFVREVSAALLASESTESGFFGPLADYPMTMSLSDIAEWLQEQSRGYEVIFLFPQPNSVPQTLKLVHEHFGRIVGSFDNLPSTHAIIVNCETNTSERIKQGVRVAW